MQGVKILWVDTETTGLLSFKHDIIQIGGMVELDGELVQEFEYKLQPINIEEIQESALQVNGKTRDEILMYPSPFVSVREFTDMMDEYVIKRDKNDKFIFAGYNAPFDYDFMKNLFKKTNTTGFNQYFEYKVFDVYTIVFMLTYMGKIPQLADMKLTTMAAHFGIEHQAHDALGDIRATKELFKKCQELIG